ncbi:DUF6011 domain-containing protein [Microvirga sp. 0TCS3.31]
MTAAPAMASQASATCRCCGRPLTTAVSIEAGLGPVCRVNDKLKQHTELDLFTCTRRSNYSVGVVDGIVCVVDLDLGARSVTNDADNVIADLVADGTLQPGQRVIYRDSRHVWDELVVRDGRFVGLAAVNEINQDKALVKIKRGSVPMVRALAWRSR